MRSACPEDLGLRSAGLGTPPLGTNPAQRAAGNDRPRPYSHGTRWITHQISGVGLAAVSAAALDAPTATAAALITASWVGAMLPDADRAGSRVHRRTRLERRSALAHALGWLARVPLRALALLPHRGPTHSVFAAAVTAGLCGALVTLASAAPAAPVAGGVAIGYLTHIAGDACTPAGVALFAPASRRRRWLLPSHARIPTGSLREYAIAGLLTVALIAAIALLKT